MNYIELAKQAGWEYAHNDSGFEPLWAFAALVAAQERDAIMKSIEELRPVEDNPLLQNKPAAFWIENFRQIVYARSKA
jgi:hypothetical protein